MCGHHDVRELKQDARDSSISQALIHHELSTDTQEPADSCYDMFGWREAEWALGFLTGATSIWTTDALGALREVRGERGLH